jgi:hypothetical protein
MAQNWMCRGKRALFYRSQSAHAIRVKHPILEQWLKAQGLCGSEKPLREECRYLINKPFPMGLAGTLLLRHFVQDNAQGH